MFPCILNASVNRLRLPLECSPEQFFSPTSVLCWGAQRSLGSFVGKLQDRSFKFCTGYEKRALHGIRFLTQDSETVSHPEQVEGANRSYVPSRSRECRAFGRRASMETPRGPVPLGFLHESPLPHADASGPASGRWLFQAPVRGQDRLDRALVGRPRLPHSTWNPRFLQGGRVVRPAPACAVTPRPRPHSSASLKVDVSLPFMCRPLNSIT